MKCTIRFRNLPALNDAPTYYFSTGVADYDNITQAIVHGQRIAMTELIGVHSFIVEDENDAVYGFPDFAGGGVKAASHAPGRRLARADDARQDAGPADAEPIARALARFAPGAAGPVRARKTCIYTSTPDEEFVIDFADPDHRITYASACSGHGFKFASLFGELLAGMAVTGETPAELEAFSAARFG